MTFTPGLGLYGLSCLLTYFGARPIAKAAALRWPLWREWPGRLGSGERATEASLRAVAAQLRSLEELLESGQAPSREEWVRLGELPEPWGSLCGTGLAELRARGAALLPTLKRLRGLAVAQTESLLEGRARTATAYAQAWACLGMVPAVAIFLDSVLPAVGDHPWVWWAATALGSLLSLGGAAWISKLADQARWGGLPPSRRGWILEGPAAGERVLSLVRAGDPPDLSWTRAMSSLGARAPELVVAWGAGLFAEGEPTEETPSSMAWIRLGLAMKRALQAGMLEGRGASERLESALDSARVEFAAQVQREVGLLASRALRPLFLFCAPAVMGLFALALTLSWAQVWEGGW